MVRPTAEALAHKLLEFIAGHPEIKFESKYDNEWRKSGVYAVLDCVFSSQLKYAGVNKALARFNQPSGLLDTPELTFDQFLNFVRGSQSEGSSAGRSSTEYPSAERFAEVARDVFQNSGKIAGRTKVEVAYNVCEFFAARGYQTKADLQNLPAGTPFTCQHPGERGELERLVMEEIVNLRGDPGITKIRGMGLALGAYLLICLGESNFVKPDTLLLRLVGRIAGDWQPGSGDEQDYLLVRRAMTCAGEKLGQPAAAVDNALWRFESERKKTRGGDSLS